MVIYTGINITFVENDRNLKDRLDFGNRIQNIFYNRKHMDVEQIFRISHSLFFQSSKLIKCDAYNCGKTFHCSESWKEHIQIHKWSDIWHSDQTPSTFSSFYLCRTAPTKSFALLFHQCIAMVGQPVKIWNIIQDFWIILQNSFQPGFWAQEPLLSRDLFYQ